MGNIILELKPDEKRVAELNEKRKAAILYLRERGLYILDKKSPQPKWGNGFLPLNENQSK